MPTPKRPTTEAARELRTSLTREFTEAEYDYLLTGTPDSLARYRQARNMISYEHNIVYALYEKDMSNVS